MSENISIRIATDSDYNDILDCLRNYYYKEEPITIFYREPGHTKDDEEATISKIKYGTVLIAVDSETSKVAGILIASPRDSTSIEKKIEAAEIAETKKWKDILTFLIYIEKKADIFNRYQITDTLYVNALAVNSHYRGQRIGEKLFSACFENAAKLNYSSVSADCTIIYSIKIAERLGMDCAATVTYEEYNKEVGEELFLPKEPNFEIKTFVKKF